MIKKYRKKPVVIEAVQWTGDNYLEIKKFMTAETLEVFDSDLRNKQIYIRTLEGKMVADLQDFIIKGIKGEFYPCKPDIFKATYEEV